MGNAVYEIMKSLIFDIILLVIMLSLWITGEVTTKESVSEAKSYKKFMIRGTFVVIILVLIYNIITS